MLMNFEVSDFNLYFTDCKMFPETDSWRFKLKLMILGCVLCPLTLWHCLVVLRNGVLVPVWIPMFADGYQQFPLSYVTVADVCRCKLVVFKLTVHAVF